MDNNYALMGDLSDAEDQQPQQQEVRVDQMLVRRQIIGRTLHPGNPIRRNRNRQGGGHPIGGRRRHRGNGQESRGMGNWNGRAGGRAGRQSGNNRGNGGGIPPKRERGRLSRKEWKKSSQGSGYGGHSRSVPHQNAGSFGSAQSFGGHAGSFGPTPNFGGGQAGPLEPNPNFGDGHGGRFDPVQNNRGQFSNIANSGSGSVQPFGHGRGSSGGGSNGNGPTYVFNFVNN